jgi:tetraacyldisaccharide 4'-kinase
MSFHTLVNSLWYKRNKIYYFLLPATFIFQIVVYLRMKFLKKGKIASPAPVIVVGNISLGGTGKTPVVIALANELLKKGIKVGIISRGYKANRQDFPYLVQKFDKAEEVGDEPLLMARKTACPVVISPDRVEAIKFLLKQFPCDIILSDDGLQHYRMHRDIEIAVLDERDTGNGWCLPAGPLREPISRLKKVDFVIGNNISKPGIYSMQLVPESLVQIRSGKLIPLDELPLPCAAVAGIGNPQRFFNTLTQLGLAFNSYSYPDHWTFQLKDFNGDEESIVMTEKDAVKCSAFADERMYYLPVYAKLSQDFWNHLWSHTTIKKLLNRAPAGL